MLIQAHGEPLRAVIGQPEIDGAEYRAFLADYAGVAVIPLTDWQHAPHTTTLDYVVAAAAG